MCWLAQSDRLPTGPVLVLFPSVAGPHGSSGVMILEYVAHDALTKVPAVTFGFWIIKILATTLGETGGDSVTMSWLGETTQRCPTSSWKVRRCASGCVARSG